MGGVAKDIILLGAPGAGKGTQGALLAEALGLPKIATGDILREAVRQGTELGREAKRFMDAGELVPDNVILGLVRLALALPNAAQGAIFDGFPRTAAQAEAVDRIQAELGRRLSAVILFEVPDEVIVDRMTGRRTDPESGAVYHIRYNPPPAAVRERVIQRADDTEETVRRRLDVYREMTKPLIARYRSAAVPIHRVDGTGDIEAVHAAIMEQVTG